MKKKLKSELQEFFDNFIKVLKRPDMAILPGQLAFFFVLAIVPTITLISYGATALNLSTDVIYDFLANAFSSDIASLLLNIPHADNISGLSFFIVVIVGYVTASNGPASIIVTSNIIYGEEQSSFLKRRFKIFKYVAEPFSLEKALILAIAASVNPNVSFTPLFSGLISSDKQKTYSRETSKTREYATASSGVKLAFDFSISAILVSPDFPSNWICT